MAAKGRIRYIKRRARQLGLDPNAVLTVAAGEGLSGGVGDGGHAFGPFQMNDAGGVLTGKPAHMRTNKWAWSNAGIDYALKGMAPVARGLKGFDAVQNIIARYERPADIPGSIARARERWNSGAYRGASDPVGVAGPGGGRRGGTSRSVMKFDQGAFRKQASAMLLQNAVAAAQGRPDQQVDLLTGLRAAREGAMQKVMQHSFGGGHRRGGATITAGRGAMPGTLEELIHDPMNQAIFDGHVKQGAYGGHGGHVHAALSNPKAMLRAIRKAQKMGLSVRENPYTDPVDPVHTDHSHHYQTFKGTFNGRKLGKAIDVSGDGQAMKNFYRWVARNYN